MHCSLILPFLAAAHFAGVDLKCSLCWVVFFWLRTVEVPFHTFGPWVMRKRTHEQKHPRVAMPGSVHFILKSSLIAVCLVISLSGHGTWLWRSMKTIRNIRLWKSINFRTSAGTWWYKRVFTTHIRLIWQYFWAAHRDFQWFRASSISFWKFRKITQKNWNWWSQSTSATSLRLYVTVVFLLHRMG